MVDPQLSLRPMEEYLQLAFNCLQANDLAAAESLSRVVLKFRPDDPTTLMILGVVAMRLREYAKATDYFDKARRLGTTEAEAYLRASREKTKEATRLAAAQSAAEPRFLLIKAWGYGFWSDASQVLAGLLLCELTQRTPVVHWGRNSLYGERNDTNVFTRYFEPVSELTVDDLAALADADFFPPKWNRTNLYDEDNNKWEGNWSRAAAIYFLNRAERVAVADFYLNIVDLAAWIPESHPLSGKGPRELYRHVIDKYLRPSASIRKEHDDFVERYLAGSPFVALHLRGPDKVNEDFEHLEMTERLFAAVDDIPESHRIFLMTDHEPYINRLVARVGPRVVTTKAQRSLTEDFLVYLPEVDPLALGREVMMDSYVAASADRFFGSGGSTTSAMISLLRDWAPGTCTLVDDSILLAYNPLIYLPPALKQFGLRISI